MRQRRREAAIDLLGGKCARCRNPDGPFDFDHIDPATKSFSIASDWGRRWDLTVAELGKCQLLCKPCHRIKTIENGDPRGGGQNKWKRIRHGTLHAYCAYGCRCPKCREAKRVSRLVVVS